MLSHSPHAGSNASRGPFHPSALPRSRTIRVLELSSRSARSERERSKSLKDLNHRDFSLNDGSIRFICALTTELCSQSTSSFSRPIRSPRVSRPVAAAPERNWLAPALAASADADAAHVAAAPRERRRRPPPVSRSSTTHVRAPGCAVAPGYPPSASNAARALKRAVTFRHVFPRHQVDRPGVVGRRPVDDRHQVPAG